MTDNSNPPHDLGALYALLGPRLKRVVSGCVQAPDWVVEDACQLAWMRLVATPHAVDHEHALGWLATTARREALRTLRRGERETSLDADLPEEMPPTPVAGALPSTPPDVIAEFRDRLRAVERLPMRQRRLVWLQAVGYEYDEIAARTGENARMIDRQLRKARVRLRAESGPGDQVAAA
jgi:RNA polymerase sigma factor (sigma-70 family)